MQTPLVLVSGYTNSQPQGSHRRQNPLCPRQDFAEITARLGATLCGYDSFDGAWYHWLRRIEKKLKLDLAQAFSAAARASKYNAILSTSEKVAIPLALLLNLAKHTPPHVVISHKLSSGHKAALFRTFKTHHAFSQVICMCRAQADYAVDRLKLPRSAVHFIHDKVDHCFFKPLKVDAQNYILSVGQEQRDYKTLAQAVAGTGLKLIVVDSSPWSTHPAHTEELREATLLRNISYQELKNLYAGARLVVVPLFDVDYAAGVNALLEAMAMGKPVIISRTEGIVDYVIHNETGLYTPPGDPLALREAILSLWSATTEADRLGVNARQAVVEQMNLDIYVEQVVKLVGEAVAISTR